MSMAMANTGSKSKSKRKRKADKVSSGSPRAPRDPRSPSRTPRDPRAPASDDATRGARTVRIETCPEEDPARDPPLVVVSFPRGLPASLARGAGAGAAAPGEGGDGSSPVPRFTGAPLRPGAKHPGRRVDGEDATCRYGATAAGRGHDG